MKTWWLSLAPREKQTVSIGAALVGIFILYEITWAPLSHKVDSLRHQIYTDQKLLTWMQASDQRIQALGQQSTHQTQSRTTASLLNLIQTQINKTSMASSIAQLQQAENDTVELHLQKVSFDNLIAWLTIMTQEQQLSIVQATITPNSGTGIIDANLRLK